MGEELSHYLYLKMSKKYKKDLEMNKLIFLILEPFQKKKYHKIHLNTWVHQVADHQTNKVPAIITSAY